MPSLNIPSIPTNAATSAGGIAYTGFWNILTAVQTQLLNDVNVGLTMNFSLGQSPTPTTLTANRVKLVRKKTIPKFTGPSDILLMPTGPQPLPEYVSSAGRLDAVIHRILLVTVRLRFLSDQSDEDGLWLQNLFAIEDAVLNSLELYWPTQSPLPNGRQTTGLLIEPMRLISSSITDISSGEVVSAGAAAGPTSAGQDPSWGQESLPFSLLYSPPMISPLQ